MRSLLTRLRSRTSASASSRPSYSPPDGAYRASAAPLWRRGLASAVDWVLVAVLYLLLLIPAGMLEAVAALVEGAAGATLVWVGRIGALAGIVAYFTFLLASGHTLGMRALDIHVFARTTGREAGRGRALARALLALLLATATVNAYSYLFGTPSAGAFSPFEVKVAHAAVAVAAVGLLGQLWMLADRRGRTLWDRLTGLVVVEEIVPAGMPDRLWSPWGT